MDKIDIHAHVIMRKGILRPGSTSTFVTPDELIDTYRSLGVSKAVILPLVNPECASRIQSNEEVVSIVEKYPDQFDWFCNIDPRIWTNGPDTDLSYFIGYYKELGAKGVGEICANLHFDDPRVDNLFYHCEKTRMPVLFHIGPQIGGCYGLVDDLGLPRLEKQLAKYPDLIFIGHSQPFWSEIGPDVGIDNRNGYPSVPVAEGGRIPALMRKYPNLHADLSAGSGFNAVSRDPAFGYSFIDEFQDRLYFGTDICMPGQLPGLAGWLDESVKNSRISAQAYSKICRDNILKLFA